MTAPPAATPPPSQTLIISDAHLDASPQAQEKQAEFVAFLRRFDNGSIDRLIVLGDLFDFWFEYKHVIFSGYFDVLRALADLHDHGVALYLICGNHDFWAGRALERHVGFTVFREPATLDFGGRRVLLVHGDGLNPRDWAYRCYKRIARARAAIWLFRRLHPDRAMGLARWVSRNSRRMFQAPDPMAGSEAQALRAFAQKTLASGAADVVICGHAHAPTREEYPTGLYLNAGDWMFHRSYVLWDGGEFHLHTE